MKPEDKSNLAISIIGLIIVGALIYVVGRIQWNLAVMWQKSSFEDGPIPAGFPLGQLAAAWIANLLLMFWALPAFLRVLVIVLMEHIKKSLTVAPLPGKLESVSNEAELRAEDLSRKIQLLRPAQREWVDRLLDWLLR